MKAPIRGLIGVIIGLCVLSAGWAVWSSLTQRTATGQVISVGQQPVSFTSDFSGMSLNTTLTSAEDSTTATVSNSNGQLTMNLNITESRDDVSDDCTDYINDCVFNYTYNGAAVINGQQITVPSGDTTFEVNASCLQASCPQNISATITLSG